MYKGKQLFHLKEDIRRATSHRFSRRPFIKGTAGLATSALTADWLTSTSDAQFGGGIYFYPARNAYRGYYSGWLEHHHPSQDTTGEKFVFVRLEYPNGDWYTNAVNGYQYGFGKASDVQFTEVLAHKTSIDVELHEHAQYISTDDEYLFNYPFIFLTGHKGIYLSDIQLRRLREYLERGGFLHAEDCDIRINNGRGGMRPAIHQLMKRERIDTG